MNSLVRKGAVAVVLLPALVQNGAMAQSASGRAAIEALGTQMGDMRDIIRERYFPSSKVTPAFFERCKATEKALAKAGSLDEASALVADALASLDPRIRFYPAIRTNRVDYSWDWRLIGSAAYVTQVDREGDAARQGLKLGDRILSIDGLPVGRENFEQIYYILNILTPRPGLNVVAQSPGGQPRSLAIASTIRPTRFRNDGSRIYTKEQDRRRHEFFEPSAHVRRVGKAVVWQAHELRPENRAVAKGLKLIGDATGLVLDLRGQYLQEHDTVLRLLEGLFTDTFETGVIRKEGLDTKLRVSGDSDAFKGTVLVLVDSQTAVYAEVLARILQQRQRGVIVGDRTMGRVFEERQFSIARGRVSDFSIGGLRIPTGEVSMADGVALDGTGVIPDYQVWPTPADLAGRRDVALSKALDLLKENLSPEDAYKLFPHYEDVDDDY